MTGCLIYLSILAILLYFVELELRVHKDGNFKKSQVILIESSDGPQNIAPRMSNKIIFKQFQLNKIIQEKTPLFKDRYRSFNIERMSKYLRRIMLYDAIVWKFKLLMLECNEDFNWEYLANQINGLHLPKF